MKRTFTYSDDKSDKFWSIDIDGGSFTVNFGKIGSAGQVNTKSFFDACNAKIKFLVKYRRALTKPRANTAKSKIKTLTLPNVAASLEKS